MLNIQLVRRAIAVNLNKFQYRNQSFLIVNLYSPGYETKFKVYSTITVRVSSEMCWRLSGRREHLRWWIAGSDGRRRPWKRSELKIRAREWTQFPRTTDVSHEWHTKPLLWRPSRSHDVCTVTDAKIVRQRVNENVSNTLSVRIQQDSTSLHVRTHRSRGYSPD